MSTAQRVKLSKKLFLSLQPGQYIMDNYIPQRYEEIGQNPENQWENWRNINGRTVTIYDSKAECLRDWWKWNSASAVRSKGSALYLGILNKKVFMDFPSGCYLLFTRDPFSYVELRENREAQWANFRKWNGLSVRIYKNEYDCVMERNDLLGLIS